jgi:hypothetical protein
MSKRLKKHINTVFSSVQICCLSREQPGVSISILALGKFSVLPGCGAVSGMKPFWHTTICTCTFKTQDTCIVMFLRAASKGQGLSQWVLAWRTGSAIGERFESEMWRVSMVGKWSEIHWGVEVMSYLSLSIKEATYKSSGSSKLVVA